MRSGATLPEARQLARHSDINVTMKYTPIGMADQAKVQVELPVLVSTSAVPDVQLQAITVTESQERGEIQSTANPCGTSASDIERQKKGTGWIRCPKLEPAGIKPIPDFAATNDHECGCEFCHGYRAAQTLHSGGPNCPDVAFFDVDLQRVVCSWARLPSGIRKRSMRLSKLTSREQHWRSQGPWRHGVLVGREIR